MWVIGQSCLVTYGGHHMNVKTLMATLQCLLETNMKDLCGCYLRLACAYSLVASGRYIHVYYSWSAVMAQDNYAWACFFVHSDLSGPEKKCCIIL